MRANSYIWHVRLILVILASTFAPTNCLFEWLFGENSSENDPGSQLVKTHGLKFEVQASDDKFLQLKEVIENLSELDACNHVIVYQLKKRCGDLTEEELGKLSVQLLNCQSEVEKRPTYTCTEKMELSECTKDMDSTTWNSYQIVNNRARALCYATQQQQFRRLSEITVNQLVSSAHGQLEYLKQLQDGQEQLHQITSQTVRDLYDSQKDLLGTQQSLRRAQDDVLLQIHGNMLELRQEKSMIATGNQELAQLTENIRAKLDQATKQLLKQENTQSESHQKIVTDLTHIQEKSHAALIKLDESSEHLLHNHQEMTGQYERMYDNMMRINSTVSHLLHTVHMMQEHIDAKINWFSALLHMADDKLAILSCGVAHMGYFLFAALAAAFLQTPAATRVALFMLVSFNATMEIQTGHSLDFVSITMFLFVVCAVNYVYLLWRKLCQKNKMPSDPTPPHVSGSLLAPSSQTTDYEDDNQSPDTTTGAGTQLDLPLSPIELKELATNLNRLYLSLNDSGLSGVDHSVSSPVRRGSPGPRRPSNEQPSTSAFTPYRRPVQVSADSSSMRNNVSKVRRYLADLDETSSVSDIDGLSDAGNTNNSASRIVRHSTPQQQRPPSRSSTSTNRSYCQGVTKSGVSCKLGCTHGSEFCHRHRGQGPSS